MGKLRGYRKYWAVLLALCLALLAGCAGGEGEATPAPDPTAAPTPTPEPPVELTVAAAERFPEGLLDYLLDTENIALSYTAFQEDAWREGELPKADLYILDSGYSLPELEAAVEEGRFRALPREAYAEQEDVRAVLDHYYPFWRNAAGELTAIPAELFDQAGRTVSGYTLYYRKDWSGRLGFSESVEEGNWTDFIPRASAFAQLDPDRDGINQTYGITAGGWEALSALFLDGMGVRDWVLEDGTWVPGLMSQRAKEGLAWMRQLYRDGVLDPDSFTQSREEAMTLFGQGRVGMLVTDTAEGMLQAWLDGHESDDEAKCLERMGVYPLPVNPHGVRYLSSQVSSRVAMLGAGVEEEKIPALLTVLTAWKAYQSGEPEYSDGVTMAEAAARTAYYAPYAWKSPLFTDWMGRESITTFDVGIDAAAQERLLLTAMLGEDFDSVWQEWVDYCLEDLDAQTVIDEVNAIAQERGIVTEE